MKEYGKCPVCETRIIKGEKCRTCGYCESLDYEKHMTLGLIERKKSTIGKSIAWKKRNDDVKEKQHQEEMAVLQKRIEEMERERQLENKQRGEKGKLKEIDPLGAGAKKPNKNTSKIAIVAVCAVAFICVVAGFFLGSKGNEINQTQTAITDTTESDTAITDTTESDTAVTDTTESDTAATDAIESDTTATDAIESDSDTSETSTAEANANSNDNLSQYVEVGEVITFGGYEQDGDESAKEIIAWKVLDKKNGKLLVISNYVLDYQPYNEEDTGTTWEKCSLRKWLNNDFINEAFNEYEQDMIEKTDGLNGYNPYYETDKGNDTEDKIFLLSIQEVKKYFDSDNDRKCQATQYAQDKGVYPVDDEGNSTWWLRSAGCREGYAARVSKKGEIISDDNVSIDDYRGVRPAMWIDF